jgi:GH18 family chitinase
MKIIGYFSDWGSVSKIPYNHITCLDYAFVRLKADGTLNIDKNRDKLRAIVPTAHANNVKVVVSIADMNGEFNSVTKDPDKLQTFVDAISRMVTEFDLDGIDVDWEYPVVKDGGDQRYLALIKALSQVLKPQGKILSIAVPSEPSMCGGFSSALFPLVSYVNIMAYDDQKMAGGSHSSYGFAVAALQYWITARRLPKSKAVLGVPTYARNNQGKAFYYKDLRIQGAAFDQDNFDGINYNGKDIMIKKIKLAQKNTSGIMIWEINGDTSDSTSMIKLISDVVRGKK